MKPKRFKRVVEWEGKGEPQTTGSHSIIQRQERQTKISQC